MVKSELAAYRKKRDFSKTPEPAGAPVRPGGSRFVVHKHQATVDHYDLRLEHEGVLKSWAVPRGPSLNPADKRYAVQTEDHPLEYIDFEAVIPQGEYGGGPMIVWDTGEWVPMGDMEAGLRKGDFKFRLYGKKLSGGWVLVRLKPKAGDKKTNWLFIKEKDAAVDTETDILAARPESVKSGLTIEELYARSKPAKAAAVKAAKLHKLKPGALEGAVAAAFPNSVKPQLATPSEVPPAGEDWLHEIKFDGYRTVAHVEGGVARLITRAGLDWTTRYAHLAEAFAAIPCKEAVLDGEIVVVDDDGVTRFSALQEALSASDSAKLTFYAFDLMHLDGFDLQKANVVDRKELLCKLLAGVISPTSAIQFSDHVLGDGRALYERASEMGLEGIVSKRASAPYVQMRSATWLKTKALKVGDFPVVGFTVSDAAGGIGALALGAWVDGELKYRGNVGTGFSSADRAALLKRLRGLAAGAEPAERTPKDVVPVRPVLSAHVHFAGFTRDQSVRHAVFKGLREPEITASQTVERRRLITDADLATISITNPTRRLFGKSGPTKLDLAVYYAQVGDFMLPHIIGRPVSLVRSPSGKMTDLFFQRHPFGGMPKSIASFEVERSDGEDRRYISIEDAKGYLALAQFGVIEFHTWGCHRQTIEKPDRVTFDLDPGEGVKFGTIVAAALHVKGVLEGLGLSPFLKTSGGKGLHVVVPLKPVAEWKKAHDATGKISALIAAGEPDTFTTNMGKEHRRRRIFIDFHRNARTATAAAAYSLRARANLPASAPVNWEDIESIDAPEDLNYSTLPGFLTKTGDPWAEIDTAARELPALPGRPK